MHSDAITIIFILVNFSLFVVFLLRRVSAELIDVFDALSVSAVFLIPLLFLLFEGVVIRLSDIIGVEFPFVIMFGVLFFLAFVMLSSLLVRVKVSESKVQRLIQELALLRARKDDKQK